MLGCSAKSVIRAENANQNGTSSTLVNLKVLYSFFMIFVFMYPVTQDKNKAVLDVLK